MMARRTSSGSSPLSRGILNHLLFLVQFVRIIPALAGNTGLCGVSSDRRGDHPRSRGEYAELVDEPEIIPGSSPLSRGIPAQRTGMVVNERIIPALAGNTNPQSRARAPHPDHPRSRGEYKLEHCPVCHETGSSPLSRGIRQAGNPVMHMRRIIPALAGNTELRPFSTLTNTDHPRSRGEYKLEHCPVCHETGSSPLSRGIPVPDRDLWGGGRDHPRSRGEYSDKSQNAIDYSGSSPLSRGIRGSRRAGRRPRRIIPALAGNTPPPPGANNTCAGSSPLSRGIRRAVSPNPDGGGIIPALAGNTPTTSPSPWSEPDHPRSRGEYLGSSRVGWG